MTPAEAASAHRKPVLGLVCITSSERVRYHALTRTHLLALPPPERPGRLRHLYLKNLDRFAAAIAFCQAEGIRLYRVTSGLFPFADDDVGREVLESLRDQLRFQGERAIRSGLRVVLHPDQFVVLNSDSPAVVKNSLKILEMHGRIFDYLGLPRSPWAAIELHGGKSGRSEELIQRIEKLPEAIRSRLALENDERAYGAEEILRICRKSGVPMVFDAHHHVIHEQLDSYDHPSVGHYLRQARETWSEPEWQLVHISNGREFFSDCRHHDLISVLPRSFADAPWIEVEAKLKEQAIYKIMKEWEPLQRKG